MTIRELVYAVWRKLESGNIPDDSKYTYRQLALHVRGAVANSLKQSYFEQRNLEDFKYGDDSVSTTYQAEVKYDDVKKLDYVELKAKPISIVGNRFTSINGTSDVSRFSTTYIPVRKEQLLTIKNQPTIPSVIIFYTENDRKYFYGDKIYDEKVYITERYAVPMDDDMEMAMPDEFSNQVVTQVLQTIINPPLQPDRQNDGVPNN